VLDVIIPAAVLVVPDIYYLPNMQDEVPDWHYLTLELPRQSKRLFPEVLVSIKPEYPTKCHKHSEGVHITCSVGTHQAKPSMIPPDFVFADKSFAWNSSLTNSKDLDLC
jgi:hypothetical protein